LRRAALHNVDTPVILGKPVGWFMPHDTGVTGASTLPAV
jgi:hypothetical protein